jgi:hypothetical protein
LSCASITGNIVSLLKMLDVAIADRSGTTRLPLDFVFKMNGIRPSVEFSRDLLPVR